MILRLPYPCTEQGCEYVVDAKHPRAPVICGYCAFWYAMAALPAVLTLLKAHDDENLYFLDTRPNVNDVGEQLQIRFFDDTKAVLTSRLRCLGIPNRAQAAVASHARSILICPP